ncbi:MAG: hypothetical protein Q8Q56_04980 [Alphaproteobacteria bacterium]|nr:hypothetical protein [Alphaproteobacteria bacterium]
MPPAYRQRYNIYDLAIQALLTEDAPVVLRNNLFGILDRKIPDSTRSVTIVAILHAISTTILCYRWQ